MLVKIIETIKNTFGIYDRSWGGSGNIVYYIKRHNDGKFLCRDLELRDDETNYPNDSQKNSIFYSLKEALLAVDDYLKPKLSFVEASKLSKEKKVKFFRQHNPKIWYSIDNGWLTSTKTLSLEDIQANDWQLEVPLTFETLKVGEKFKIPGTGHEIWTKTEPEVVTYNSRNLIGNRIMLNNEIKVERV